jgi:hypothetical protein
VCPHSGADLVAPVSRNTVAGMATVSVDAPV